MDYPKEGSRSLYDYSDKSVRNAGYAAMAYAALNLFSASLVLIRYFLYHSPGTGGLLYRQEANQQWLQNTPFLTAVAVAVSIIIAVSGILAFFIFRRSRPAIVGMIALVVILQLYTWFLAHSLTGTLPSIIVVAFLLRGAWRIFQDHAERELDSTEKA